MILELKNKDQGLQSFIYYLFEKYGDKLKIKDHWDSDKYAIGLTDITEEHLVYISTFGLNTTGYYIALETLPQGNSELPYKSIGEFDILQLDEVEHIIAKHLNLYT